MSAKNDLEKAQEALDKGVQSYSFEGKTYSLRALNKDLIPLLKKRVESEKKKSEATAAEEAKKAASRSVVEAQKSVDAAQKKFDAAVKRFVDKGTISEAEVNRLRLDLQQKQDILARLSARPTPTTKPTTTSGTGGEFVPPVPMGVVPSSSVTGDEGATGGAAAAPKKVTRANVTAELAKRGLPDTPENRATVRAELEGTKAKASWEELVAQQAGEYAYLLDPKYEGVPELLRKAVEQKWFASEEGKAQFLQEFKKTAYAQNTTKLQQAFDVKTPAEKQSAIQKAINDIRAEYGEIQFDQAALEEVAGVAARNGSTGIDLGRLVYRAAFKRGAAAPTFTAPTAAKTALGGSDADRIRAIYRAYGQRPDDDQIARILAQEVDPASGVVMTEDMLRNNLRDLAKVSYKPFADLLDRGVSVQTIFSPYQQIAASVLEQAPDQVALIDDRGVPTKFATALMGKEPMSLTDWITTLKSDNKYGWQFTNEAKQQATNLVMDLEKAFGYRA